MELSDEKISALTRRLLMARLSLLETNGFYGLLLMGIGFALDDVLDTAWTDGKTITFNPEFLDKLTDEELKFVMQHEILHAAMRHPARGKGHADHLKSNIAADIVVNSNILSSNGGDVLSITLGEYGESMHLAPNGKEGYLYSMEEVYEMLGGDPPAKDRAGKSTSDGDAGALGDSGTTRGDEESGRNRRAELEAEEAEGAGVDACSDEGDGEDDPSAVAPRSLGASRAPNGWDWHVGADDAGDDWEDEATWRERIARAAEAVEIRQRSCTMGGAPLFAKRILEEIRNPKLDWRTLLDEFVQEELSDYSFNPPDRRFPDSPFLLPDYNVKTERVENVWFLIDTSGSISDEQIREAYGEICGAIEQFSGRLSGLLSFTESYVTKPIPFENIEDVLAIKPVGGGGNDFSEIFRYMREEMDDFPSSIVILTDGYDYFPSESAACGVPVLWLIDNDNVTPPWGRVARLSH